jgi:hypothetical protein
MITFRILSTGLVIWILIVFIEKYASSPVETQIAASPGIPPMAMAFCLSKYITEYDYQSEVGTATFFISPLNVSLPMS